MRVTTPGRERGSVALWVRAADALTIVLLLVAAFTALHPIRTELLDVPIRIQRWWRVLVIGAAIALGRHWLVPAPSLLSRLSGVRLRLKAIAPTLADVVPVVVSTRLLVLLIGYFAVVTFGLRPQAPPEMGRELGPQLPMRWDAGWYLKIVHEGYSWSGSVRNQQTLNFFPAYPMATRFVSWLVHARRVPPAVADGWSGTGLSVLAFLVACVYLHRLVAEDHGQEIASATVLLIATYPFAYFYSAVYPEALFLLSAVAAWYHLKQDQLPAAAVWGMVAGLCRPNGGLLAIPLGLWVFTHRRDAWGAYAAALAPMAGTLAFSAWAYQLTGHPFVWAELQRTAFARTYRSLGESLGSPLGTIYQEGFIGYMRSQPWELTNLAAALLGIAAIWPVWRRVGVAAAAFVAINVFTPLLNGGLVSMGRYTAVLFPIFIWLALAARAQTRALLAVCFAIWQGVLAALFFTWWPVF